MHFESPLVILNNTYLKFKLTSKETVNNKQTIEEHDIFDRKVFNPPLTWFTNPTDLCKLILDMLI